MVAWLPSRVPRRGTAQIEPPRKTSGKASGYGSLSAAAIPGQVPPGRSRRRARPRPLRADVRQVLGSLTDKSLVLAQLGSDGTRLLAARGDAGGGLLSEPEPLVYAGHIGILSREENCL